MTAMNLHKYIILLILALVPALNAVGDPASKRAHGELLLKEARQDTRDPAQRLQLYDSVANLGVDVNSPEILREKAIIWRKLRDNEKEIEYFQAALKATPEDSVSHKCQLLLNILDAERRAKQWTNFFKEALALKKIKKPDSLKYYDVLVDAIIADAFYRNGNFKKASAYAQKARKRFTSLPLTSISDHKLRDTEASLLFAEGNAALEQQDYSTALNAYKKVKSITKEEADLQLADASFALICQRQGDYKLTLAAAKDNLLKYKGTPNGPISALNLLRVQVGLKDAESARQLLTDYAEEFALLDSLTKKGSFEVTLAEICLLEENYEEAFDHLAKAYETLENQFRDVNDQYTSTFDSEILDWESSQNGGIDINWQVIAILLLALVLITAISGGVLYSRTKKRILNLQESLTESEYARKELMQTKDETMEATHVALDERTRDLSRMTLNLAIIQELIEDIRITSGSRQLSDKEAIARIRMSLKEFRSHNDIWNLFKGYFEKLNQDFFNRLYKLHPDLSNAEIRMCAFIQMGLTTKEISIMTNRSPRTVNCIKYNLRKKCGVTISTEEYLRRIATMEEGAETVDQS